MPENIWSFNTLGKAVHNAITLFYHLPQEERVFGNLKEKLMESWTSEALWNKKPPLLKWGGFPSIEEERKLYGEALSMLRNFLEMAGLDSDFEFLPTNDLRHSINDFVQLITKVSEDFDISGKFDLVSKNADESLNIIDFKTGRKEDSNPFQLEFYKALAELHFKKPVRRISFYFLRSGVKKDFDPTENNTDKTLKEITKRVLEIKETKDFKAIPTKLCKYCLFKLACPEKTKVAEIIEEARYEPESPDDLPF